MRLNNLYYYPIYLCAELLSYSVAKILAVVCVITMSISNAHGQFNETIRTGRPGQAIGAFTVGGNIFQVQSGFDYFRSTSTDGSFEVNGFLNNTVVRYGLTEPFEVSALFEYKTETLRTDATETEVTGLSAFDVGMRYHIFTGKGLLPNVGFQIRFRLPALSDPYQINDLAPRFIFATSQKISERFTLITNLGAAWNGNNSSPTGTYVFNLSFPFNDSFGSYIEMYGSVQQGVYRFNFDSGIAWLLNPNLQLDLHGGMGRNHGVIDQFVSLGISTRTSRK